MHLILNANNIDLKYCFSCIHTYEGTNCATIWARKPKSSQVWFSQPSWAGVVDVECMSKQVGTDGSKFRFTRWLEVLPTHLSIFFRNFAKGSFDHTNFLESVSKIRLRGKSFSNKIYSIISRKPWHLTFRSIQLLIFFSKKTRIFYNIFVYRPKDEQSYQWVPQQTNNFYRWTGEVHEGEYRNPKWTC